MCEDFVRDFAGKIKTSKIFSKRPKKIDRTFWAKIDKYENVQYFIGDNLAEKIRFSVPSLQSFLPILCIAAKTIRKFKYITVNQLGSRLLQ